MDHGKLWRAPREMGIPELLTCLLRNLHVGQEATVIVLAGTTDWLTTEKGIWQGRLLSAHLSNMYIMRNAGLDELQAGIKTGGRNINIIRYVDDTTLMAESKEELKSLLMNMKERVKELA